MGRNRQVPTDLPQRLHEKHGGYYYVIQNVWELLSRDRAKAISIATGLNALKAQQRRDVFGRLRSASLSLKAGIHERDGWKCVYCDSTADLGIDHVIPFELAGATLPFNLVTACADCNSSKGMGDPRVFIAMMAGCREQLLTEFIRLATTLLDRRGFEDVVSY